MLGHCQVSGILESGHQQDECGSLYGTSWKVPLTTPRTKATGGCGSVSGIQICLSIYALQDFKLAP